MKNEIAHKLAKLREMVEQSRKGQYGNGSSLGGKAAVPTKSAKANTKSDHIITNPPYTK